MTRSLIFFITLVFVLSCSKDEKITNQLTGEWNVKSFVLINETSEMEIQNKVSSIEFLDCDSDQLKNFDCSGRITFDNSTTDFLYRVESNDQKLLMLNNIITDDLKDGKASEVLQFLNGSPIILSELNGNRIVMDRFDSEFSFIYDAVEFSSFRIELVK